MPIPLNKRTHCPHGHEVTAKTLGQLRNGIYYCRTCGCAQARKWREARRAEGFTFRRDGLYKHGVHVISAADPRPREVRPERSDAELDALALQWLQENQL